ncbi:MAG: TolC family protein [Bacteroidales bacterium]|nr:TolC family protein [Bacteroidales bacterium]
MKQYLSILCFFCTFQLSAQTRLTLEQCLNMALEHNKSIAIAQEQVGQAAAQKKVAHSSYLPKVDATAAYLYSYQSISLLSADKFAPVGTLQPDGTLGFTAEQVNNGFTMVDGKPVPLDANGQPFNPKVNPEKVQWKNYAYLPKDAFSLPLHNTVLANIGLTQPLYMGGRIRELNRIADFAQSIAKTQLTAEQTETLYSAEENYWQVVSLTHKVRIADEYKALMSKLEANLEALQEEGMATKNDVLKVKVRTNEVNVSLTKANNGLRLSKMALCRLIGMPLDSDIALEETFEGALPTAVIDSSDVWRNRAELQSLDYLGKIAESKVKIAQAGHLPTLGLKAGYLYANPNPYNGFMPEFAGNFTVAVALQVPIFHWGEHRQTVNVARSERNIAQLKREEASEKIELQYTQARLRIKEAAQRSVSAHKNLEQAEENLRYANMGFEEGMVQVAGVLEAQTAWFSAYSEMIDARIETELSEAYLKKVSGVWTK